MTPPELVDELHSTFSFGLDGAASSDCYLAPDYIGPDHLDPARRDSFESDWAALSGGKSVFLNPPYGREMGKWMELAQYWGKSLTVACLVFARTDTAWWWERVLGRDRKTGERLPDPQLSLPGMGGGLLPCASEIWWRPGRITFLDPATGKARVDKTGRTCPAPAPSVLVVYRPSSSLDWPANKVWIP